MPKKCNTTVVAKKPIVFPDNSGDFFEAFYESIKDFAEFRYTLPSDLADKLAADYKWLQKRLLGKKKKAAGGFSDDQIKGVVFDLVAGFWMVEVQNGWVLTPPLIKIRTQGFAGVSGDAYADFGMYYAPRGEARLNR